MGRELAVKIVGTNKVRQTSRGNVIDVGVKTLDTGMNMNIGCFLNDNDFVFNVGDEVKMVVSEGKPYQGKQTFSTSVDKIVPFIKDEVFKGTEIIPQGKQVEPKKESPTDYSKVYSQPDPEECCDDKPDWDGKERRDFRSRALAQVSSKLGMNPGESELEWADRVIMVAELRFLEYIYNGYQPPKEILKK